MFRTALSCLVLFCIASGPVPLKVCADDQGVYRFVLTDTAHDKYVREASLSAKDFGGVAGDAEWSIHKQTLRGGKQEGVDLIVLDNGKMKIRIIPTRGMSILDMSVGDFRLGWNSPVKEVVHPQYVDLDTRGGLGWLDGFNEWMVRCGIEFAGHPGKDQFVTNTGDEAEMDLTLHGKVGNIPASHVEVRIQKEAPHRLMVRGVVHERMFFGPKLQLVTTISTVPGSTEITVSDEVTNQGAGLQEMQLIYHTNYGAPLLEEGATLVAPVKKLVPMNDTAAPGLDSYATYSAPTPGFLEQVYLTELYSEENGMTQVCLKNRKGNRAASIRYRTDQLPYFTVWKNTTAEADGYVTGLEPGTCYPYNRRVERAAGRVPQIKPNETRRFDLIFGLHNGADEVKEVVEAIEQIQGDQETEVIREPPSHE